MAILQPNRPQGSGFTNLQRILQANQQNRLGSTVSGGIQQAGQSTRQAITAAGQKVKSQAEQERDRQRALEQRTVNVLGNVPAATDDDVGAFEEARAGLSKAPGSVENAAELRQKAREAEQLGQAAGSQAGRYGLLQRYVGGGQKYTSGQQRVDALLLGQTGGEQLRTARKTPLGLQQRAETEILSGSELGKQLGAEAKGLSERTKGRLGEQVTGYDTAMQAQLEAQKAQRQAIVDAITGTGTTQDVELDDATLKQLAEASNQYLKEGSELYNVALDPYVKQNLLYANKQAAQTADDFKKAQMLKRLYGADAIGSTGEILQSYLGSPEQVGQFSSSNVFDVTEGDLADAINKAREGYQGQESGRQKQLGLATRFLGVARPDEYNVSGGYTGAMIRNMPTSQSVYNSMAISDAGNTSALDRVLTEQALSAVQSGSPLSPEQQQAYNKFVKPYNDLAEVQKQANASLARHEQTPGSQRGAYQGTDALRNIYGAGVWNALQSMIERSPDYYGAKAELQKVKDLEAQKAALEKEFSVFRKIKKKAQQA